MYDCLRVGTEVDFDVRGFRRGKIVKVFQVNGVTYCSIMQKLKAGYVELHPRVGLPRINVLTGVKQP